MNEARKARAVGFNHVALEVGDIEEALSFYGCFLEFELRSKSETELKQTPVAELIRFMAGRLLWNVGSM